MARLRMLTRRQSLEVEPCTSETSRHTEFTKHDDDMSDVEWVSEQCREESRLPSRTQDISAASSTGIHCHC